MRSPRRRAPLEETDVFRRDKLAGLVAFIAAGFASAGCAATARDAGWADPRPLGRDLSVRRPGEPTAAAASPERRAVDAGPLTLREALALALLGNPDLAAASWQVRVREAEVLQAGLLPNPELEIEVEEFGGSEDRGGFDSAETTVLLSQVIQLGGKVGARTRVAELERDLAGWDFEAARLQVLADTAGAFIRAVAAQRRLALAEKSLGLAEQVFEVIRERVAAGKVSPLEESRAGVALATTRIARARAERSLLAARTDLAARWGGTADEIAEIDGDLERLSAPPALASLLQAVSQSPSIARWETEAAHRLATLEREKAAAWPDVAASGGVLRFEETDDWAFVVGLSIDLPIFDRNQGGIGAARHQVARAREERRAAVVAQRAALEMAYHSLVAAFGEASSLRDDVMPAAQRVFEASREAYERGKVGYLEVLDAQRTLFEARGQYVDALSSYHESVAEVEGLVAAPLVPDAEAPDQDEEDENRAPDQEEKDAEKAPDQDEKDEDDEND